MAYRLLANENFPRQSVTSLREHGHDVTSISELAPSIGDTAVMEMANREERWILTFDRDYGDLIFRRNLAPPPGIILFRLTDYHPALPAMRAEGVLSSKEAAEGGFFVVTDRGQRWRPYLRRHGGA